VKNLKRSLFIWVAILGTSALSSLVPQAWAKETADDAVFSFTKFNPAALDSFARLQDAHRSVLADTAVRAMLHQSVANALSITDRVTDPELETTKFQQFFKGIEVVGARVFHHRASDKTEITAEIASFDLDTQPALSAGEAVAIARSAMGAQSGDTILGAVPILKIFPSFEDHTARLIYWVGFDGGETSVGQDILIDANTGDVLSVMSRHIEIAPVNVLTTRLNGIDSHGCQVLDEVGRPQSLSLKACPRVVANGVISAKADQSARQAAGNSKAVLNYYMRKHGRDSYDGRGGASTSVVHIGKQFDNAFWSSELKIMAYGDGDGVNFGDFTRALDVAGHEMTHGLTSETAKLIYMDQSGALNEAFSDFFGKMIANDSDWIIGKKLFLKSGSNGIRDLAHPGVHSACAERDYMGTCMKHLPYPAHVNQMFPKQKSCGSANDNCWVHINSTVPGHAMYLVSEAITKAKAERLFFLVLTHFMSESSNFKTFSTSTVKACRQLYDAVTCTQVQKSLRQVGL